MELFDPKRLKFDFVSRFKFFGYLSAALMVASIVGVFVPGLNYGIDFRGGIEAQVAFTNKVEVKDLRETLDPVMKNLAIVSIEGTKSSAGKTEFLITAQADSKESGTTALKETLTSKYGKEGDSWVANKMDVVGPRVGKELRKSAILALIYTCLLVTLYLYWRFDIRYSPGALACIAHDLVLTAGLMVVTRGEFSGTVVAALLTLAGYSINDTVVVFDRIRELELQYPGRDKKSLLNEALNSTLSRTMMTAGSTLGCCIILFLVGGATLREFSYCLFFGILTGTYSSMFIASPFYLWADKYFSTKQANKAPLAV